MQYIFCKILGSILALGSNSGEMLPITLEYDLVPRRISPKLIQIIGEKHE